MNLKYPVGKKVQISLQRIDFKTERQKKVNTIAYNVRSLFKNITDFTHLHVSKWLPEVDLSPIQLFALLDHVIDKCHFFPIRTVDETSH